MKPKHTGSTGMPAEGERLKTLYDEIALRAYYIWEREGRPEGRQHEHWARAEAEILHEHPVKNPAPKKAGKKTAAKKAPAKKAAATVAAAGTPTIKKKKTAKPKPAKAPGRE